MRPAQLPATSAFATLDEAAAFLKYQPAGISLARPGVANIVHITRDENTGVHMARGLPWPQIALSPGAR
jgi:hypothetical protein